MSDGQPPADAEFSNPSAADEYQIADAQAPAISQPSDEKTAAWTPAAQRAKPGRGRTAAQSLLRPRKKSKPDDEVSADDFPGPFLDRSALFFPWLYPTWACWLGLAFITELDACAIGAALFFFAVIMTFGAFVSLFTFASMVTVCVGLTAYVLATFETVVEQTAHGDNRLRRLPGFVWYELLPSLKRVFGASASSAAVSFGLTYATRDWLGAWYEPQVFLLNNLMIFLLFPIFMISNSVEQSFLPIWALIPTLTRLARCFGFFLLFLWVSGIAWAVVIAALVLLAYVHIGFTIAAAGPLLSMWLLYYAHWLGRVVRQMMALE